MKELAYLRRLTVGRNTLMDCQKFAHGTYSPLTRFMNRQALALMLHDNRLPDRVAWTLPVVLQLNAAQSASLNSATSTSGRLRADPGEFCTLLMGEGA